MNYKTVRHRGTAGRRVLGDSIQRSRRADVREGLHPKPSLCRPFIAVFRYRAKREGEALQTDGSDLTGPVVYSRDRGRSREAPAIDWWSI